MKNYQQVAVNNANEELSKYGKDAISNLYLIKNLFILSRRYFDDVKLFDLSSFESEIFQTFSANNKDAYEAFKVFYHFIKENNTNLQHITSPSIINTLLATEKRMGSNSSIIMKMIFENLINKNLSTEEYFKIFDKEGNFIPGVDLQQIIKEKLSKQDYENFSNLLYNITVGELILKRNKQTSDNLEYSTYDGESYNSSGLYVNKDGEELGRSVMPGMEDLTKSVLLDNSYMENSVYGLESFNSLEASIIPTDHGLNESFLEKNFANNTRVYLSPSKELVLIPSTKFTSDQAKAAGLIIDLRSQNNTSFRDKTTNKNYAKVQGENKFVFECSKTIPPQVMLSEFSAFIKDNHIMSNNPVVILYDFNNGLNSIAVHNLVLAMYLNVNEHKIQKGENPIYNFESILQDLQQPDLKTGYDKFKQILDISYNITNRFDANELNQIISSISSISLKK
ncbi:MAG: hypothetical protein J0H68_00985 [Sphingobacteriia bacterium]|nr:hypothetical protein [Sphingobacteriia bacterium]